MYSMHKTRCFNGIDMLHLQLLHWVSHQETSPASLEQFGKTTNNALKIIITLCYWNQNLFNVHLSISMDVILVQIMHPTQIPMSIDANNPNATATKQMSNTNKYELTLGFRLLSFQNGPSPDIIC